MSIFKKGPDWGVVYRLDSHITAVRSLLVFAFWIWGLAGFGYVALEFDRMFSAKDGVGIGTSGFVTTEILFWVAGMLFFGMAALLSPTCSYLMQEMDDAD